MTAMRTPKDIPAGVSMAVPSEQDLGDCFGTYSIRATECQLCHAAPMCLVVVEKENRKKLPKPLIQGADFSLVDWGSIAEQARKGMSSQDLVSIVSQQSRCSDDDLLIANIKEFLVTYSLKIVKGRTYEV